MSFESEGNYEQPLSHADELLLTEVDHLTAARLGTLWFDPKKLVDVRLNLESAVQEAAMPFAVTTTEHEVAHNPETGKREIWWLGRTAVRNAMFGYQFHTLEAATDRIPYEVDEAIFDSEELQEGDIHAFISPRLSKADATIEDARREHLGDDDAVRVSWLQTDANGQQKRIMQSLLVRDIPLDAWTAMLTDKNNIFGKSIALTDIHSALSVIRVHRELVLPRHALESGPVSIIEAVIPYISDSTLRKNVHEQFQHYYGNQEDMRRKAAAVADRWLEFEAAQAESIHSGRLLPELEDFIYEMGAYWNDDDIDVFERHRYQDGFRMSRHLAVVLERAKRNVLWSSAAMTVQNDSVAKQVSASVYERIRTNELLIQLSRENGLEYQTLEAENSRLIASQNIKVGGGCPGDSDANFKSEGEGEGEEKSEKKWMKCPHCNAKVYDDPCAKVLSCSSCRALVVHGQTWSKGNGGAQAKEEKRLEKLEQRAQESARAEKVVEIAAPVAGLAMTGVNT